MLLLTLWLVMPASSSDSFPLATIVRNDPLCFWLSNYVPIGVVLVLAMKWGSQWKNQAGMWELSASSALGWTLAGLLLLAIVAAILFRRVSAVRRILAEGPRVEAAITHGEFRKHGVRVQLAYTYRNQSYTPELLLTKTAASETLRVGARLEVALAEENPNQALIVKLFAPPENETA